MQFTPCLYFRGDCESALNFYENCGLGKIQEIRRYEGTPMTERAGAAWREKVLHSVFEGPGLRLCASDGPDSEPMNGHPFSSMLSLRNIVWLRHDGYLQYASRTPILHQLCPAWARG